MFDSALEMMCDRLERSFEVGEEPVPREVDGMRPTEETVSYMEPFWKMDPGDRALAGPARHQLDRILWLKRMAANDAVFFEVLFDCLPRAVHHWMDHGHLGERQEAPPWTRIVQPLFSCRSCRPSSEKYLTVGGWSVPPAFLPCPDPVLKSVAEEVSRLEKLEEGCPSFDLDEEMAVATIAWERQFNWYFAPLRFAFNRLLEKIRFKNGAPADYMRAYITLHLAPCNVLALHYARRAYQQNESDPDYRLLLAEVLASMCALEQPEKDRAYLLEGIRLLEAPLFARAGGGDHLLLQGRLYRELEDLEKAEYCLRSFNRLWPFLPEATFQLAEIAHARGDVAEYERWKNRTIVLDGPLGMWTVSLLGPDAAD